jgi:ComF family protein
MHASSLIPAAMRKRALAALLPQDCVMCGAAESQSVPAQDHSSLLCGACHADLPWLPRPCCPVCALPTPGAAVCGRCIANPPHFDATRAALAYRYPIEPLMQFYKYRGGVAVGALLAKLLGAAVSTAGPIDFIAFVPLSGARLAERGFNQALEIARPLSKSLAIALRTDVCFRARHTGAQAALPYAERRKNVRGAFACLEDLSGLRIAVVDDVMTTGATLDEIAKTLKKRGAIHVENWVVARALPR